VKDDSVTFGIGNKQDPKDIEANRFAIELLMPRRFIIAELKKRPITCRELAELFQVSEDAMTARLATLRL